jgi:hypothetical protein
VAETPATGSDAITTGAITMKTIQYETGRTYDGAQVLEIYVLSAQQFGEWDMRDIIATFRDRSRGINGRVETVVFGSESIGKAVLEAYDAGRYTII